VVAFTFAHFLAIEYEIYNSPADPYKEPPKDPDEEPVYCKECHLKQKEYAEHDSKLDKRLSEKYGQPILKTVDLRTEAVLSTKADEEYLSEEK